MALTNSQYDTIMRLYQKKQLDSKRELDERIRFVYQEIPALQELEHQIAHVSVQKARRLLAGNQEALMELKEEICRLSKERESLLHNHGYSPDILDPVYECPDCQDTGYIGSEKCHCFRQKAIDLIYTQSNLKDIIATENFSCFSLDYYSTSYTNPATNMTSLDAAKRALLESHQFIDTFDREYRNLFFYGDTGVGKTFLSHCIAKELMDTAHSVLYFSSQQLFDQLAQFTFQSGNQILDKDNYFYNCDLLIIDDLGTELTNTFVASQLFSCLNERAMRKKSTIISTNLTLDIFSDIYSERVFSRITSNFTMLKLFGSDIRIQKKIAISKA